MSNPKQQLADKLRAALAEKVASVDLAYNEVTVEVAPLRLIEVATELRDEFKFQQLVELAHKDWRDVIMCGEYEYPSHRRLRDFDNPFGSESTS